MNDRIDQAELDRALRQTCRRIASAIIKGMADGDVSIAQMADRLGKKEKTVDRWLRLLIAGIAVDLDRISDMCFAMGAEMEMTVEPLTSVDQAPPKGDE